MKYNTNTLNRFNKILLIRIYGIVAMQKAVHGSIGLKSQLGVGELPIRGIFCVIDQSNFLLITY